MAILLSPRQKGLEANASAEDEAAQPDKPMQHPLRSTEKAAKQAIHPYMQVTSTSTSTS
jgi:hypothetical protein